MSEKHQRCRFWPRCAVHRGEDPPGWFSDANVAEMAELRAQGWKYTEIGEAFGTRRDQVSRIVTGHRRRHRQG